MVAFSKMMSTTTTAIVCSTTPVCCFSNMFAGKNTCGGGQCCAPPPVMQGCTTRTTAPPPTPQTENVKFGALFDDEDIVDFQKPGNFTSAFAHPDAKLQSHPEDEQAANEFLSGKLNTSGLKEDNVDSMDSDDEVDGMNGGSCCAPSASDAARTPNPAFCGDDMCFANDMCAAPTNSSDMCFGSAPSNDIMCFGSAPTNSNDNMCCGSGADSMCSPQSGFSSAKGNVEDWFNNETDQCGFMCQLQKGFNETFSSASSTACGSDHSSDSEL